MICWFSIGFLNGNWISKSGDDIITFSITNPYENFMIFNSGTLMSGPELFLKTEDDGVYFYINAYLGKTEVFAGTVERHKTLNEIRINRFDGGVDMVYTKK